MQNLKCIIPIVSSVGQQKVMPHSCLPHIRREIFTQFSLPIKYKGRFNYCVNKLKGANQHIPPFAWNLEFKIYLNKSKGCCL